MKTKYKRHPALLFVCFGSLVLFLSSSPAAMAQINRYYVLFENIPDSYSDTVTFKTFDIGKVVSKELYEEGKYVRLTIEIRHKYQYLMQTNTTFYFKEGKLICTTFIDEPGALVEPGGTLYGFENQARLEVARAKYKTGRLYKDFREWWREFIGKIR
jgi:hypothetical protein